MSKFFIHRPIVAIVIAIVTVLVGLVAMQGLPIAQFPDIVPPQINVTATYPGADSVTIEQSVATPLEQQMNGVDHMLYMQSINSNDGTMTLNVTFDVDTNPNIDQVNVQNRIAQAQPNDIAVAISTSGGSVNIILALEEARKRNLLTVALLGYDGGEVKRRSLADFPIVVRCDYIPRIQEVQASIYHTIREMLEVVARA